MKTIRPLALLLLTVIALPSFSQDKKFDKSLKKDRPLSRLKGDFKKASANLVSLRKSIVAKLGQKNTYVPGLFIREARINLGAGLLKDFDKILNDALLSSGSIFGDNSIHYASTLVDVAAIYNDYGNYRISREYVDRARDLLTKTNQLTEPLKDANWVNVSRGGGYDWPGI